MAEIGQVIAGRYRLMELRGEDAFSATYGARDNQGGGDVAVRVLSADLAADPDFVAEFRLQMRAVMGLNHPNILALYDFGVDGGEAFIVTELLNGQQLGSLLQRNGPVPPRRAATVTSTVARALADAHDRGIVHSGVRSGCVLVARDGQIKVGDFGLARALADSGVQVNRSVEEAWYLSPEQVRGRRATDASDQYALGVLLFELLTGHGPWDGASAREVAAARTADPSPIPSDFQDGIPADIVGIDQKAMGILATERFDSAERMADALDKAVERMDAGEAQAAAAQTAGQASGRSVMEEDATSAPRRSPYGPAYPAATPPLPLPGAMPPTRPVLPPVTPRPQPVIQRRPNPTMQVSGAYAPDAYAGVDEYEEEQARAPEPPRRRMATAIADVQAGRAATDRVADRGPAVPARAPRRINPGDSAPDATDEEEPVSMWAWVAAFLALFLVTLLGLTVFLLISRNAPSTRAVYAPDLSGQTFSQAQQTAQGFGLQVAIKGTQKNDGTMTDNTIIDQSPAANSSMNRGDTIYVTIVSGSGQVKVPSIVGLTESEAINSLTSSHLQVGNRSEAFDPNVPDGQVVSSNPRADVSVAEGSKVDYVVSKGPEPTPSPTASPTDTPAPSDTPTPTPAPTPTPTPAPTPTPTPAPTTT